LGVEGTKKGQPQGLFNNGVPSPLWKGHQVSKRPARLSKENFVVAVGASEKNQGHPNAKLQVLRERRVRRVLY